MPKKMFLSFASANRDLAEACWAQLRASLVAIDPDYDLWSFTERLVAGDRWDAEIRAALKACDIGVFAVSRAFFPSAYITEVELDHFVKSAKAIVPVLIEPLPKAANLGLLDELQIFGKHRPFSHCRGRERIDFANDLADEIHTRRLPQ